MKPFVSRAAFKCIKAICRILRRVSRAFGVGPCGCSARALRCVLLSMTVANYVSAFLSVGLCYHLRRGIVGRGGSPRGWALVINFEDSMSRLRCYTHLHAPRGRKEGLLVSSGVGTGRLRRISEVHFVALREKPLHVMRAVWEDGGSYGAFLVGQQDVDGFI